MGALGAVFVDFGGVWEATVFRLILGPAKMTKNPEKNGIWRPRKKSVMGPAGCAEAIWLLILNTVDGIN